MTIQIMIIHRVSISEVHGISFGEMWTRWMTQTQMKPEKPGTTRIRNCTSNYIKITENKLDCMEDLSVLILQSILIQKIDFIFRSSFALFDPWSLAYQVSRHWPNLLVPSPNPWTLPSRPPGPAPLPPFDYKKWNQPLQINRAIS